jgi:Lon protease-like protein
MPTIPLFPLGLVLLPGMPLQLHIFEERYKQMISECMSEDKVFGIVLFDGRTMQAAGCTARVAHVLHRYEDGRMDILTRGERRFILHELIERKPYMEARVEYFGDDPEGSADDLPAVAEAGSNLLRELAEAGVSTGIADWPDLSDPRRLSFAIAALDEITPREKQRFLEMTSSAKRLRKSVEVLGRVVERIQLTQKIQTIIGGNGHPPRGLVAKIADPEDE